MNKRSVGSVLILTILTLGIYALVWRVKTKNEMVSCGADIPTAWLMIVPFANIYWVWKYAGGVEHISAGKLSQPVAFLFMVLLPFIDMAIFQDAFNKAIDRGVPGQLPQARVA